MQANLTSILDEVMRLGTISRKLLLLSQADAGKMNLLGVPFDLSAALHDLTEDTRMLAPQLLVTADVEAGLVIQGDAGLLRQLLHNLVSNAIKYNTPPDAAQGWIRIIAQRRTGGVEVVVSNSSEGLSVSREIARAHGGDLTLQSDAPVRQDDTGSGAVHFCVRLPLSLVKKSARA